MQLPPSNESCRPQHEGKTSPTEKEAPVKFVCPGDQDLEVIKVGPATITILEDGSETENRFAAVSVTLGPQTPGPTAMWHRLNDTTFYVLKGQMRFYTSESTSSGNPSKSCSSESTGSSEFASNSGTTSRIVKAGDFVVVPRNGVHNFDNPFDEPVTFLNTFTPAYYVSAIRVIASKTKKAVEEGRFPLSREEQLAVMQGWATFPPPVE
ncbi:hypothetical protein K3495_g7641 [Podosphaera aphanis]|nr:hypothetical protein K3495_g7641 [Podosphaera aphanis]